MPNLDATQSVTLFRIIQESLNNVAKHSQAGKVEIRFILQEGALLLRVKDNGIGFDPDNKTGTFGLLGIKERARMIGGEARIDSAPGLGTEVSLSMLFPRKLQSELNYS